MAAVVVVAATAGSDRPEGNNQGGTGAEGSNRGGSGSGGGAWNHRQTETIRGRAEPGAGAGPGVGAATQPTWWAGRQRQP